MTALDSRPLWTPRPEAAETSQMAQFFAQVARRIPGAPGARDEYARWHEWSVREPAAFWSAFWRWASVAAGRDDGRGDAQTPWREVLVNGDRMQPPSAPDGPRWFTDARLSYTGHLLQRRDETPAIIARDERGRRVELSWKALNGEVARVAEGLRAAGVRPGDRAAGFLPNVPAAVIAALASNAVGAVWSSCSPDFGAQGVLDRFGQIEPVVLFVADGYTYAGKGQDCLDRAERIVAAIPSIRQVVVLPFLHDEVSDASLARVQPRSGAATRFADFGLRNWRSEGGDNALDGGGIAGPTPEVPRLEALPFDHPLFVMYSSGTTGLPKCMVHGQGGTLLQHLKEHRLHCDLRPGDRMFYFTTCGWMMWNWLLSALASEVTIVLYDGAPMPKGHDDACWDLVAEERVTHFGTSAKFLALSEKAGHRPGRSHDLSALRMILSTGSPLAEHSYDFVYREVHPQVHLASISGGTDLISCFALGNPLLPVWRGELQCFGLGMAVDVWGDDGKPLRGAAGELVCTRPFPSMPVAFWNDPDGAKYRGAYFEHFPGVWRHGDWAEITPHGGLVIHGRSDATLNPGGVRIGTAEIYREVEQLPEVVESVVIGQEIVTDGDKDVRIVLFVRLRDGLALDGALRERIRQAIRARTSPHHVPKVIVQVTDIPRTISNKISEIAVREVVHGRPVKNTEALANPGALSLYRDLAELRAGTDDG
ncbi:MAG: acetoacetate--CoA ligase [Gemmatimonadaceae bacterium]|nr:acetoacetate--CoA ligase [Gemmatimonadaceae bacterium]MCW5825565.1 acetoacetate--CoA ligase [Gemmatimonadaceae bacterium]